MVSMSGSVETRFAGGPSCLSVVWMAHPAFLPGLRLPRSASARGAGHAHVGVVHFPQYAG